MVKSSWMIQAFVRRECVGIWVGNEKVCKYVLVKEWEENKRVQVPEQQGLEPKFIYWRLVIGRVEAHGFYYRREIPDTVCFGPFFFCLFFLLSLSLSFSFGRVENKERGNYRRHQPPSSEMEETGIDHL